MADTSSVIVLDQTDPLDIQSRDTKPLLQRLGNYLHAAAGGNKRLNGIQVFPDGAALKPAVAHIALASCAAGTVIEVNGAPFLAITGTAVAANDEVDIDGADAADAADLARAINASTHANIYKLVKAVNPLKDKLTAATAIAGNSFAVTLADGVKHTFIGKAGASTVGALHFSIDTSDSAVATDIAAQVNGYAPFSNKISASASSAVVTFRSLDGNDFTLVGTATTLAESGGTCVTVSAIQKGALGNGVTVKTLGVVASGTVTYSSSSGAQTVVINGVTVYNATGASDSANASAAAAAINASTNVLVAAHVRATSSAGVCSIYAKKPGLEGNIVTLAVTGTGATASAARLAGGTLASSEGAQASGTLTVSSGSGAVGGVINGVTVTVSWAASDNNSASLIAAAINATSDALIRGVVVASAATNVVTITAVKGGLGGNAITLAASGTGVTASGARLASGALPTTVVITSPTAITSTIGAERMANGTGGAVAVTAITC